MFKFHLVCRLRVGKKVSSGGFPPLLIVWSGWEQMRRWFSAPGASQPSVCFEKQCCGGPSGLKALSALAVGSGLFAVRDAL